MYVFFLYVECVVCLVKVYVPGNNFSHVETISSPRHTFFLGKLDYAVNQYFVHILSRVTDKTLLESEGGGE